MSEIVSPFLQLTIPGRDLTVAYSAFCVNFKSYLNNYVSANRRDYLFITNSLSKKRGGKCRLISFVAKTGSRIESQTSGSQDSRKLTILTAFTFTPF